MLENNNLNKDSQNYMETKKLHAAISISCFLILIPVAICAFKDSDLSVKNTCTVLTIIAFTVAAYTGFKFFRETIRNKDPDDAQPLDIANDYTISMNSP